MRSPLFKSCLTRMLALATACGGAPEADVPGAPSTDTRTRAELSGPAPEDYELGVDEEALTLGLLDKSERVYWACGGACNAWLHAYNFPRPYEGLPTLEMAVSPFEASDRFWEYSYYAVDFFPFS